MQKYKQEQITKEFIKTFLPENPIIIEAGAHIGRDTVKMAKILPNGLIYAFEPVPSLFNILKQNTQEHNNVKCYQFALAEKTGTKTIFVSSGRSDAASSLLSPNTYLEEHPTVQFKEIEVKTITLDEFCKQNNINQIDLLWLDMQGYEPIMLQASENILNKVKIIHTEVNLTERYKGCMLYPEYKKWLEQHNFELIKENIFKPTWGNALFINKAL